MNKIIDVVFNRVANYSSMLCAYLRSYQFLAY